MNKPDLEVVNRGHKAFLMKLEAPDGRFSYFLRHAAVNLCLTYNNDKLKGKLEHADKLIDAVKLGFEQMETFLGDLSEEERDDLDRSKAFFTQTFKENPEESKTVDEKELNCAICRRSFNRPKLLPCSHVFCMDCLEETGEEIDKNPGDMMPCERCGQEFRIPAEGFDGLENSESLGKVLDLAQVSEPSSTNDICEACAENSDLDDVSEIPLAVIYCEDCNRNLCEKSQQDHQKLFKSHRMRPLDDPGNISAALEQVTLKNKSDELPEIYKSDPVLRKTIATKATIAAKAAGRENKPIQGLAILKEELFVVTAKSSDVEVFVAAKSSDVEVFDSMMFNFSRRWSLKELSDPLDIVSCSRNECLYILDSKGRSCEIQRVDADGELIKIWSIENECGRSLSVTDDSNIIVTLSKKSKLHEYSPDGKQICEINLPQEILNPLHAIKLTSDGDFMISHGFHKRDLHRVCIVDANNKLKKSFGRESGKTIEQLDCPSHFVVDASGFVMVVDKRNARVLLLDPNLEFKKEIISKRNHNGHWMSRILLDESSNRLLVIENWGRGWISIFSFRRWL